MSKKKKEKKMTSIKKDGFMTGPLLNVTNNSSSHKIPLFGSLSAPIFLMGDLDTLVKNSGDYNLLLKSGENLALF